jgi:hypothetical protein
MSEQLTTILARTGLILLMVALWGATVAFVAWDTSRRNLTGYQQFIGVVLALVPLIGFGAYLIARPFFFSGSGDLVEVEARPKKRLTFLKSAASGVPKRLPTIPAAEYLRAIQPDQQRATRRSGPRTASSEPAEKLTYSLSVAEGPHAGENFSLDKLPAYIGRGPACAIRLDNDRGVSRRHAELYQQDNRLRLRDLDSTHGTHVNGDDTDDKALMPSDKIQVGYSLLIVKTERCER